ncbi:hypothetical protein BCR44DRAFT_74760 [Catenaria anguillulae PL171]|uniref:Uncharacterized protein n=1 Tax=Catenaria anguillulae PL171 TaxID=765915 RepID=A0A1Y2H643_9FUNG|nr:hypothetical protein BCR44DRAFT_74760 [Catenaria anguillulae PL171]
MNRQRELEEKKSKLQQHDAHMREVAERKMRILAQQQGTNGVGSVAPANDVDDVPMLRMSWGGASGSLHAADSGLPGSAHSGNGNSSQSFPGEANSLRIAFIRSSMSDSFFSVPLPILSTPRHAFSFWVTVKLLVLGTSSRLPVASPATSSTSERSASMADLLAYYQKSHPSPSANHSAPLSIALFADDDANSGWTMSDRIVKMTTPMCLLLLPVPYVYISLATMVGIKRLVSLACTSHHQRLRRLVGRQRRPRHRPAH